MSRVRKIIVAFSIAATLLAIVPADADADGPLRRWWRSLRANRCGCSSSPTQDPCGCDPQATAAPNAYNLQPGQCMTTCQKTCTRTVVNYVPCTSYRTCYKRVPVTTYKPVTNTDPCTGCVVTCMKPCTTYTVQTQRVPYTTYRPVYRTETYKVPVTTITNNCATGSCSTCPPSAPAAGCSTCGPSAAPGYAPVPNYAPSAIPTPAPTTSSWLENPPAGGAVTTEGNTGAPADQAPSLLNGVSNPQTTQRPVIDQFNPGTYNYKASVPASNPVPTTIRVEDKTARSPARQRWSYSPMRLASYNAPTATRSMPRLQETRQPLMLKPVRAKLVKPTSGWVEVK